MTQPTALSDPCSSTSVALHPEGVRSLMLTKQHLDPRAAADDVRQVLDDLLGCHATVPSGPYLQLRVRMRAFAPEQLDTLLDAGQAARVPGMRRTLFVESEELVPIVLAATRDLATRGQDRYFAANGLTRERYAHIAKRVEAELSGRALSARQLRAALESDAPVSPVVIVMCDEGRLVRWKGRGGWGSSQPTYRRWDEALRGIRLDTWAQAAAVRELIDRYVRRYGPVTLTDVAWWTGLSRTIVRDALAAIPNLVGATVVGSPDAFLIHESDVEAAQRSSDSTPAQMSLLPVLDPYLQGYRNRERCVDPAHLPFVVDRSGNSTSVLLIGGRAAGVWDLVAKPSRELRLFFFGPLDTTTRARVMQRAAETAEFLTGTATPVVEVDHMTPLTHGRASAGTFLSPLRDA